MSEFYGKKASNSVKDAYARIEGFVDRDGSSELTLPSFTSFGLLNDPKQLGFRIARHKFVSKMLAGSKAVLEVGCQEGFTSLFIAPEVGRLVGIDFSKRHIADAEKYIKPFLKDVEFFGHDILDGPVGNGEFDAAFSLDVLEHIEASQEHLYMENIAASLEREGVFIVGMPSLESQKYASETSRMGHINCKSGPELKAFCKTYFRHVFMFGMNDEVLHTGFFPMCQYLFAVCAGKK
jgi:SAM-dependent methyltransferase